MKARPVVVAIVIGVARIIGAGTLFALSRSVSTAGLEHAVALLQTLQQLDSQWSVEVLQVSSNPQADFDGLATLSPEVRIRSQELRDIARTEAEVPADVKSGLLSYVSRLDSKEERVERFKSDYAIVRNSQRYLPLAVELVTAKTAQFNQGDLGRAIKTQHADLDNYFSNPSELDKQRLMLSLDTLRMRRAQYPADVSRALGNFLAHALVLLEQKGPLDELLGSATSMEAVGVAQGLAGDVEALIQGRENERARYQQFSFRSALLMLVALTIFFALARRSAPVAQFAPAARRESESIEGTLDLSSDSLHLYGEQPETPAVDPTQRVHQEYLLQALRAAGKRLGSHMALLGELHNDITQSLSKLDSDGASDQEQAAAARTKLSDISAIMDAKSVPKVLVAMRRSAQVLDHTSTVFTRRCAR